MSAAPQEFSAHRRAARARSPRTVADDLAEVDQILDRVAVRYPLAHDLAFTAGGGPGLAQGASRGNLEHVHPTEDVATSPAKDAQRHRVARVGRKLAQVVKLLRDIDGDLAPQHHSKAAGDPTWQPSPHDSLASDEELGQQLRMQRERARRGEL